MCSLADDHRARMRGALQNLIVRCDRRPGKHACPIIETLAGRDG